MRYMDKITDKISTACLSLGIKPDKIDIHHNWEYNIPYINKSEGIHKITINKLNSKIMDILTFYKLDAKVKEKYGRAGWKTYSEKKGFANFNIKPKIRRYIKVLNDLVCELGVEVDFKDVIVPKNAPEEIRKELVKRGVIKDETII